MMWEKHFLFLLWLDMTKVDFVRPQFTRFYSEIRPPIFSKKIIFLIYIYSEKKQLHGWNPLSSPLINNSKDLPENIGLIFHPMKTNQDSTYLIPKILSSLIKKTLSNLGSKKFWFLYTFILIKDGMWKHRKLKLHVTISLMKENQDAVFLFVLLISFRRYLTIIFLNLPISLYPLTSKYISVNSYYYR